jgi:hypothetical protein
LVGFAIGLTFRLLAIRLKLEMPKFVFDGPPSRLDGERDRDTKPPP